MFIRAFAPHNGPEINLNVAQIETFVPTTDKTGSVVQLASGRSHTINLSNRALRHAIKKATGSQSSIESGDE